METLPIWAQNAGVLAIALISAIVGVIRYLKTESKESSKIEKADVIEAFVDARMLKDVIAAIRELQDEQSRDAKRSHRLSQDLRESVNELNESIIVQTDTTMNLVRFINRETNKQKLTEEN